VSGAFSVSLPPPVGGWDALNAQADMPPQNAVELINWFPVADQVITRPGYVTHATALPAAVETLLVHQSGLAVKLFAASGSGIYDVTTAGAVGAAAVSGLTSAQFQWTQMGTAAGMFLWAVNGADGPQMFDGTTWTTPTVTGAGLTAANLIWVNQHQRRLWFGETGKMRAWYLGPNSVSGAAAAFDFGSLTSYGGALISMGTWTRDGGSGADDLAVFLTDQGEVLIYSGLDPATDWTLQGVFRIGRPLGRRPMIRAGADLLVMTEEGFIALSSVLPVDRSQQSATALSKQINPQVTKTAALYRSLFGWQAFFYPRANMLIFNVPVSGGMFEQYVFNTITAAAARFTGVPARCWALVDQDAYFGADAKVVKFDAANNDDGVSIRALAVQAPNALGVKARKKALKRIRVTTQSEVPPTLAVDAAYDYSLDAPPPSPIPIPATLTVYDTATYDLDRYVGESTWRQWRGVRGQGTMVALRVQAVTNQAPTAWIASDILFVPGGVL
jgi:hypothetical protein